MSDPSDETPLLNGIELALASIVLAGCSGKPNDRVPEDASDRGLPDPKIYLVVDGGEFLRPSLETYYARTPGGSSGAEPGGRETETVNGTYCSCNKVCSCNLVCTCQSVCNCQSACSCVGYTGSSSGGSYCSCNKVCTCVPVH
jgi:hypothetical protein